MGRITVFDEPAEAFAEDLLSGGLADLRHRIIEAFTYQPLDDGHVADVCDALALVVADPRPAVRDKAEARRLLNIAGDFLAHIGRRGAVLIVWRQTFTPYSERERDGNPTEDEHRGIYQGSWGGGDPGDESYETSPEFATLEEALFWARARAPHVRVRPRWDTGAEYWAGDDPRPDRFPPLAGPPS
ncbi:hypothetical protein [Tomitella biformata]|uniref:hypothetical protein n=1 Tax=Tomitella biformata TaxID=630403 RepID=UPI0004667D61|nr:hypothetical protein [Tomitella biformata]